MEFEISDRPDHLSADQDDGEAVDELMDLDSQSSISPENHPDLTDRALHIPEEED